MSKKTDKKNDKPEPSPVPPMPPEPNDQKESEGEVIVLIHPMARGYGARATADFNEGRVKIKGNILLPDGQEVKPAGAYKTAMSEELRIMMRDQVVVAGSKVMMMPKQG